MQLTTLWGERKGYEGETPELMVAWDENSIDQNGEGFEKECEQAIASWGNDLVQWRTIVVTIPEAPIFAAFDVTEIKGAVEVPSS